MCKIYGRYLFFEYRPSFFVDILKISAIIEQYPNYPGVAQLVARLTGGQEAASSSLVTRTKNGKHLTVLVIFFAVILLPLKIHFQIYGCFFIHFLIFEFIYINSFKTL